MDFLNELNYMMPNKHYNCLTGHLRIYFSSIDMKKPDDFMRHRYITYQEVKEYGENKIIGILRRAFCQDIHFYDSSKFIRVETCKDLFEEHMYQDRLQRNKKRLQPYEELH